MKKTQYLIRLIASKVAALAVVAVLLGAVSAPLFAQTAEVRYAGVFYKNGGTGGTVENMYCDWPTDNTGIDAVAASTSTYNRSFTYHTRTTPTLDPNPSSAMLGDIDDPWVNSALIEYDQPYPNDLPNVNKYPNHCLALCMNVYCNNRPNGGSTYSITFPLQEVKFDIVKYYNQKNLANADEVPAQRTISLYPNQEHAKCGSYRCPGRSTSGATCNGARYYCDGSETGADYKDGVLTTATCATGKCKQFADGETVADSECSCTNGVCTFAVFNNDGISSNANAGIPFCAAWDGSYEIAGEFGKSNGQFGYRATVATDAPGDQIITDKITFNSTIVYPGMNQIPIQVDVTNIHTVRSTPSLVGSITAVSAQPYTYSYRLSKDADVRIAIFDASNKDSGAYGGGDANSSWNKLDWADNPPAPLVRTLVDWQPRLGEGMKGVEKDVQISEFDSWDGRDDRGLLLPAGNYVVALQAKAQDEWPGVDFSRAVTRQLSLDPLKLTDIRSVGLNKQSTAYASIQYVATESAKVYWNIYTPGTMFKSILTDSTTQTGTAPTIAGTSTGSTGELVYSAVENRTGRMNFTSKWDGLCGMNGTQAVKIADGVKYPAGAKSGPGMTGNNLTGTCNESNGCTYYIDKCIRTYAAGEKKSDGTTAAQGDTEEFAYGAPMPDANYVYVLWAEIPYNGCYYTASSNNGPSFEPGRNCQAGQDTKQFTGVKTLKYSTGIISVDRGVVDVTIQPVSYATVGSSPTAYGLDPFIFKYSIARDATAIAKVENTAGVVVKYLTPQEGITQVAQQMNTISWDGRDNAGRMVYPGTYMFVVETKDAMFPSVTNRAMAVFPVDMYRLVDVATTDVYGDSDAKATISYRLSKAMNVQVNIYNKDVVIPDYNSTVGEYSGYSVTAEYTGSQKTSNLTANISITPTGGVAATLPANTMSGTGTYTGFDYSNTVINEWTVSINPAYVEGGTVTGDQTPKYIVSLTQKAVTLEGSNAAWPPRICDRWTDGGVFFRSTDPEVIAGTAVAWAVNPAKNPKCIYVRDTSFTNYPSTSARAQSGVVDVRLQPIHTFDRSATRVGDGYEVTEEWDALYFYNPTPSAERHTAAEITACANATDKNKCPYEMLGDGQYPFYISARSNEPFNRYYFDKDTDTTTRPGYSITGQPFKYSTDTVHAEYLYATEKPVSKINITRGPVYFLDGSTVVYPNAPQLFNVSSGPIFVPPYEINFSVSRAATVEVAVVALKDGVCNSDPNIKTDTKQNKAGDVCKFLSTMTIANTGNFDPNMVRKLYWDGTDMNGFYVKPDIYEIRLTARNYPDAGLYQATVKRITLNADLLKVFDLLEADGYAIAVRGTDMRIGYQVSVPMKVAIQILKPGTTIFDYQKGTLRNPTTGKEVQDIREVLVKSIVGIRPATTLIEELWDGTDYAGQEVPDGTYPFRFVTALNSADIDTVTGEIVGDYATTDALTDPTNWKINKVADTYEYQNLHKATIAIGDGRFVCADWEKTVFFYPNPLKNADRGTLEITKMPVPGEVSIKFFNLAGDLVRDSGYTCVDANNYQTTMGSSLSFNPDNNVSTTPWTNFDLFPSQRNAALRCRWDRTNQHGKKVARGVYFGLVDFKAKNGREHCQKVVKVLVP